MADAKITELTELTTPAAGDMLAIVDADAGPAATKKIDWDTLGKALPLSLDVEAHTADDTLTTAETGSLHTNLGEDGEMTLTLPASAPAGTLFYFAVMVAQQLRVKISAAGKAFYAGGSKSTDDGGADLYLVADAIGECLALVADGNGDWVAISMYGTWTATQP